MKWNTQFSGVLLFGLLALSMACGPPQEEVAQTPIVESDRDGDGLIDRLDTCPDQLGPKENQGCPDMDGDGVLDKDDFCRIQPGPATNSGCPLPSMDKLPIILVPIGEVQKWNGTENKKFCLPPNEVATIFQRFCVSKGYENMRYGLLEGQCERKGIVPQYDLYLNVICFNMILNQ